MAFSDEDIKESFGEATQQPKNSNSKIFVDLADGVMRGRSSTANAEFNRQRKGAKREQAKQNKAHPDPTRKTRKITFLNKFI